MAICARCRIESGNTNSQSIEHIRAHYQRFNAPVKPKKVSTKKVPAKAG